MFIDIHIHNHPIYYKNRSSHKLQFLLISNTILFDAYRFYIIQITNIFSEQTILYAGNIHYF